MQRSLKPPKGIIIFGTGTVGMTIARLVKQRGWTIRGAVNRAGDKVGQDFGDLSSATDLKGIIVSDAATTNFSSFNADVAIVAVSDRLEYNAPHHKELLEAGLNVICLGTESSFPWALDSELAREYDEIARSNGVTFTGGGLWDAYRIWTLKTLVGPCTSLRKIHHRSVTDADRFGLEVVRLAKIGEDCATFNEDISTDDPVEYSIYRVLVPQVVTSIGLTVQEISERKEPIVSDTPVFCAALNKTIQPGLCTGTRSIVEVTTKEGVSAIAEIDLRLTKDDDGEWMSWTVDGDPPAQMRLQGLDTGHATASSVVNRIPDVIEAQPGIVTVDQMPAMSFSGEQRNSAPTCC